MWPYPWTHVGTPSHLGHMDRVAATMPSQAHAGAAQEAPDIGQWEGQDVPLVRPSSCNVKGGIPSSRRYLPTYLIYKQEGRTNMDIKKEDTDLKTAPEAPAMPAPGEPGPGPSAVRSEPLHGPVDVAEDSMEGLQSAFWALSVEEVDTHPVKRKRESEKDAGESIADKGADQGHDPTNDLTFEGAPSASGLHPSPSPITTTLTTPDPAAATSTPITNPPMAEGTGFTGMPTYPAYGVNPPTTAFPEATTTSEPVTSSSAPRWYAADYHHPLPATATYVDVPGYATLSGLRRGPESCGSRSRGSGRSSNRSLTRSEINEVLQGATSKIVGDLTQEI